jgi:hypothetical protein
LLIQEAQRTSPTGDAIIRAVRAYCRVTRDGRWVEPPKHLIISRRPSVPASRQPSPADGDPNQASLIETRKRLKIAATDTKQAEEAHSNRVNFAH